MRPLLLPTIIILGLVLKHNAGKNRGNNKNSVASYIKREENANFTRRQDISNLPYITIPFDQLPLDITLKDKNMQSKIVEYQKIFQELSDTKMLNLIGVSNVELKERYGPANLEQLSSADANYSRYIRTLSLYADCIMDEFPKEAVAISQYCIRIGTDISSTYVLLGNYYYSHEQIEQFNSLYDAIPDKESIAGKTIVRKLENIRQTNHADN